MVGVLVLETLTTVHGKSNTKPNFFLPYSVYGKAPVSAHWRELTGALRLDELYPAIAFVATPIVEGSVTK